LKCEYFSMADLTLNFDLDPSKLTGNLAQMLNMSVKFYDNQTRSFEIVTKQ